MKNKTLLGLLLLASGALTISSRKHRKKPVKIRLLNNTYVPTSTVIYYADDLDCAKKWYDDFFNREGILVKKNSNGDPLKYSYLLYQIDKIKVYVTTDKDYKKYEHTYAYYYWTIEEKKSNQFAKEQPDYDTVKGPSDAKIGITNNPIYVPT